MGEKLKQVAMFANNIAMEDEEDLGGGDTNMLPVFKNQEQEPENPDETGAQRLQRALTVETKQKGLFRFANTLGSTVGIEPDVLMRVALEDEWQMVSCASLPFTIIFFVIFMLFFQLHYGVTDIYLAEAALRDRLGTPATEIQEAIEIYDWLETKYFPYLWTAKQGTDYDQLVKSPSLFQELIAGVRLSTTVAKKEKCKDDLVKYMDCYSEYVDGEFQNHGVFGRRRLKEEVDGLPEVNLLTEQTEVRAEELPFWAKPGLSESWQKHLSEKSERLALEPLKLQRKPSAEARDWSEKRSLVVGKKKRKHKYSILFPSAHSKHSTSEDGLGGRKIVSERRLSINRPEIRPLTPRPTDGNKSRIVIPTSMTLTEALAEVARWKTNKVINERTLTFTVEALVQNKNLAHELLSSVVIDFSIHRGGNVFTEVKIVTLVLTGVSSKMLQLGIGLLWLMCLFGFSVMLPSRAFLRWRQGKLRSHFLRFWNLLEWGIISWGWLVLIMFVAERISVMALKSDIEKYQHDRKFIAAVDYASKDEAAVKDFLETSSTITELSMWCQMVVALYHIVLVMRFFLASRGQPRLAVVLTTIRKAFVDLSHLFIVFMIIFIAYAISGHILFGRRMEPFSTFQGAFARCFQLVMEREYTWAEFTEEDLWTATLWVWSFLILVVLVLVNIFLAMIFDTYGDVRSSVGHSATIWQTTKIVLAHVRHMVNFGDSTTRWVSNRELVQGVKSMQCNYITPWMVKDAFPGISNKQVNYLFNLGKNRLETMLLKGNKSSLPAVIASILLGVERMTQGLHLMEGKTSAAAARKGVAPSTSEEGEAPSTANTTDDVTMLPPATPPPWLKVQLVPHFQKQRNIMTQVCVQIQAIEKALQSRGLAPDLGQVPGTIPKPVSRNRFGSLGARGSTLLEPGTPTGAIPPGSMLPAARRAGLTASSEDKPLMDPPKGLRKPGG